MKPGLRSAITQAGLRVRLLDHVCKPMVLSMTVEGLLACLAPVVKDLLKHIDVEPDLARPAVALHAMRQAALSFGLVEAAYSRRAIPPASDIYYA